MKVTVKSLGWWDSSVADAHWIINENLWTILQNRKYFVNVIQLIIEMEERHHKKGI